MYVTDWLQLEKFIQIKEYLNKVKKSRNKNWYMNSELLIQDLSFYGLNTFISLLLLIQRIVYHEKD